MREPLQALARWWRWEMGRTIEVTGFIRFIIAERLIKGTLLVIVGVSLIALGNDRDFNGYAAQVQQSLNLDAYQGLWARLYDWVVQHLATLHGAEWLGVGAVLYGLLEGTEGVGLILRRRWAEYLLLVATVFFIPFEIREVVDKRTVLRIGGLLLNIVIAAYLIRAKRLFLERPGTNEPA